MVKYLFKSKKNGLKSIFAGESQGSDIESLLF